MLRFRCALPGFIIALFRASLVFAAPSADVSITQSWSDPITAGTNAIYDLTITNNGPSIAQAVTFSDTLPAYATLVSAVQNSGPAFGSALPVGGVQTYTVVAYVSPDTPNGTVITNTTSVSSTTADPTPGNNSHAAVSSVDTSADISVINVGSAAVTAGTNAFYTLNVSNNGPSDAQTVTLTDVLPTGTTFTSIIQNSGPTFSCTTPSVGATGTVNCSAATLAAGATAAFTLVLGINANASNGTVISNTITASTMTTEPTSGNNTSTATSTVNTNADISLINNGPHIVVAGTDVAYNIVVSNNGPSNAQMVQLTDAIPSGMTFVSLMQTAGPTFSCSTPSVGGTDPVMCSIATLASGATATFTLTDNVNLGTTSDVINTATVSSTTTDPTPANNTASVTTRTDRIFANDFE